MSDKMTKYTFTKLRNGDWGIRGPQTMKEGHQVFVDKKDGSRKFVTVGRVIWRGKDAAIAAIAKPQRRSYQRWDDMTDDEKIAAIIRKHGRMLTPEDGDIYYEEAFDVIDY